MKVAVIGGGAAGFFAAINVKENFPNANVTLFEKTNKLLSKVKISGGGRCNVTNGTKSIKDLCAGYPRGGKQLKKLFKEFNTTHTAEWFESKGVPLKTEADNRVFPISDDSQSIVNCLQKECARLEIIIKQKANVLKLNPLDNTQIELFFQEGEILIFDKVIIASGGSPKKSGLDWLEALGHEIINPVPSLFTFNMPDESVKNLMGLVAEDARVSIIGSKLKSVGPLLITHWGMSGPAILKLSSLGARELADKAYTFTISVNWINQSNQEYIAKQLFNIESEHPKKLVQNIKPFDLPNRLWKFLIERAQIPLTKIWGELGKKGINRLVQVICHDTYEVKGKTTFKEEFVTCGGVSLESVNMNTLESKHCPNLYFAGEVLDIDGITGGYNFQAAWTTGYFAGKMICEKS